MSDEFQPEVVESAEPETLSPEVADEALCPDVSSDTFVICGKTVKIKPLTVFNQIKFTQLLNRVFKSAAFHINEKNWTNAVAEITAHPEVLPALILVICDNDKAGLTEDNIGDQSDVDLVTMAEIIIRLAQKNEKIGKPVLDFFSQAWPLIKQNMAAQAQVGMMAIQNELAATTTILSRLSANDTESSLTKSPEP